MNDAERDAWLREALRHAPDSDALPPSGVSEAILLKARAAARATAPPTRRAGSGDAHANPLTALWNWLARPPVAAGFASVMAATLVGLMWWDRPMDEAMPRPPALASDRAPASTSPAPAAAPPATVADATPSRPDARTMSEANVATDDGALGRRKRSAPEQAGAADAELADRLPPRRPSAASTCWRKSRRGRARRRTKRRRRFPRPKCSAKRHHRANRSTRRRRTTRARRTSKPVDREPPMRSNARPHPPRLDRSRRRPWRSRHPWVAAPTPAAPQAPLASGRLAADERRPAAPVESPVAAKEKSAAATPAASPTPADAPRLQQPQSAFGGMREQDAAGLASSPPVPSATSVLARRVAAARIRCPVACRRIGGCRGTRARARRHRRRAGALVATDGRRRQHRARRRLARLARRARRRRGRSLAAARRRRPGRRRRRCARWLDDAATRQRRSHRGDRPPRRHARAGRRGPRHRRRPLAGDPGPRRRRAAAH